VAAGAGIQSPAIWTSGEADGFRVIARGDKRAAAAGIATRIGNHSFRATGITVFQKLGGPFVRLRSWRRLAVGDRSPEAFVADSPLEGSGFEPSVPRQKDNAFRDSPQLRSSGVPDSLLTRLLRKATRRRASLMLMRRIVLTDHNL
jgi:hypothetical protein